MNDEINESRVDRFKDKEITINNDLVSKLQIKKNKLRNKLKEKGILVKGATNDYDNYEYFSEAQYKELFTELFCTNGLEFDSSEVNVQNIDGTDKQPFAIFVTMEYTITDIDTGYSIKSIHSGIAIDKGDKAIYKAKTGALKSYLASTFLVATKDDPERTDKSIKRTERKVSSGTITEGQKNLLKTMFKDNPNELKKILATFKKKNIVELNVDEASKIITNKKEGKVNE